MVLVSNKVTVEEFFELELPDDATYSYELLNGILVRRNAPSGEHQLVQSSLLEKFFAFVAEKKLGRVFSSPTSVVLSDYDAPQPDVLFLSNENIDKFDPAWGVKGAPDLIVEILSPSSFKADRSEKKALYEEHGVKEYWLVDPNYKSIEVFILKKGKFTLHAFGVADEKVTSVVLAGLEIEVAGIFSK